MMVWGFLDSLKGDQGDGEKDEDDEGHPCGNETKKECSMDVCPIDVPTEFDDSIIKPLHDCQSLDPRGFRGFHAVAEANKSSSPVGVVVSRTKDPAGCHDEAQISLMLRQGGSMLMLGPRSLDANIDEVLRRKLGNKPSPEAVWPSEVGAADCAVGHADDETPWLFFGEATSDSPRVCEELCVAASKKNQGLKEAVPDHRIVENG